MVTEVMVVVVLGGAGMGVVYVHAEDVAVVIAVIMWS